MLMPVVVPVSNAVKIAGLMPPVEDPPRRPEAPPRRPELPPDNKLKRVPVSSCRVVDEERDLARSERSGLLAAEPRPPSKSGLD